MGLLDVLAGGPVYLDTNIWIYALENYAEYTQHLGALFQALDEGALTAVTSELTLAEVLVKPMQREDTEQQTICERFIRSTNHLAVVPVSRAILIDAARVRTRTQLKLPDAIHVATAIGTDCKTLLTNDQQLRRTPNISVVLLSEAIVV
ncbi:MAG: PIN domain-containing protein [Elainellaceae cyanobacterium]